VLKTVRLGDKPRDEKTVHGRFLQLEDFLLQNCAIQRKAARTSLLGTASEKQTAQHNPRPRAREALRAVFSQAETGLAPIGHHRLNEPFSCL
jgi:hypothetical protein